MSQPAHVAALGYPHRFERVGEHLTPDLEVASVTDPGEITLWFHPRQAQGHWPSLNSVYEEIKHENLLPRSVSYGELRFFEDFSGRIPVGWKRRGLWIFGLASVCEIANRRAVPYLACHTLNPYIGWDWLDLWGMEGYLYAQRCVGLRAP